MYLLLNPLYEPSLKVGPYNMTPHYHIHLHSCASVHLQLFDVVYREETLFNVIQSVTKNGRSILLTAVLAVILIYLFSIVGFMFFQQDFSLTVEGTGKLSGTHTLL